MLVPKGPMPVSWGRAVAEGPDACPERRARGPRAGGTSPGPHPEPGGGSVVQVRGWGRGALQTRDGRGAVAQREAEAEWAQGSGEGGEEDAAAAGRAAVTGPRVSGADAEGREGEAASGPGSPGLTCRQAAPEAAGFPLGPRASCPRPTPIGQLRRLNGHRPREGGRHRPLAANGRRGAGGGAGRDRNRRAEAANRNARRD